MLCRRVKENAGVLHLCLIFFNDTATTEIYTLSLHDALPICSLSASPPSLSFCLSSLSLLLPLPLRSEEHTSELQSHLNLVCRLLLVKHHGIAAASRIHASSDGGAMVSRVWSHS